MLSALGRGTVQARQDSNSRHVGLEPTALSSELLTYVLVLRLCPVTTKPPPGYSGAAQIFSEDLAPTLGCLPSA